MKKSNKIAVTESKKYIDISWSHVRISQELVEEMGMKKVEILITKKGITFKKAKKENENDEQIHIQPNRSGSIEGLTVLGKIYDMFDWLEWDMNKFAKYKKNSKGEYFFPITEENCIAKR